ncbi:MAG: hypothetical protein ABI767_15225 [Rhodanobacter sp.]
MGKLYVVQCFHEVDGCVLANKPILHGMESLALERGRMLATEHDGVLVYAQMADADQDKYSQPMILAQHGLVPYPERQTLGEVGYGS